MKILSRDSLTLGGFEGIREHRLVTDSRVFGQRKSPETSEGIGNFVYLADAQFIPKGETGMHPHKEIDVISVMIDGRVSHEGSLEHGQSLMAGDVQVQRAGGEGFSHNEINPDDAKNRMLQLWVLPEVAGEPAAYRKLSPAWGETVRIYGGLPGEITSFPASTTIDLAMLKAGQNYEFTTPYLAYVAKGDGEIDGKKVTDGDLIEGSNTSFKATTDVQLVIISTISSS